MLRVRLKKSIYYTSIFFFFDPSLVGIIFKKAFKKNKNIERLKFLGRKLSPEGGQIPHCTRLVQHLSVNHRRWSVAQWEDHPLVNAVVVDVCLNGVTIKLVQGCWVCFQPSHFLFLRFSRSRLGCFAGYFLFNLNVKA